ncbi:MAG: NAD(P)H-dependent glycerol-3-phosphate dehydrogenase [Myxococcota bacterium]
MPDGTKKITIMGADSFAGILARLAAETATEVLLYSEKENAAGKTGDGKRRRKRSKEVALPASVRETSDIKEACNFAPVLILAMSAAEVETAVKKMGDWLSGDKIIIHTAKGLLPSEERPLRVSEVIRGNSCIKKVGALSLPNIPAELASDAPVAAVIASPFIEVTAAARMAFTTSRLQVFRNGDIAGVEIAGALKEVYSIAVGVAEGLGFGAATKALVFARAVAEMTRLGVSLGAKRETFAGLASIADLFAAVESEACPHYLFGVKLGRADGKNSTVGSTKSPPLKMDGVATVSCVYPYARSLKIPMPILFSLHDIFERKISPATAAKKLIAIAAGAESEIFPDAVSISLHVPTLAPKGGEGKR